MQEYLKRREELIAQDRALRPDNSSAKALASDEKRVDEILRSIRTAEAQSIWDDKRPVKHIHGPQQMFPGMEFLTARETIVGTELFEIISEMPKGGLLHAHLDATVRVDVLLRLALEQPAMHVRTSELLTPSTLKTILPEFRALPKAEWTSTESLTESLYSPGSWVPIKNARNNFSLQLGGPMGFDRWVIDALMINPSEAYGTHNTTAKIWEKFQSTFIVSDGLIRFVPVWTQYVREFLLSSIEDGISYVEPRIMFWFRYMVGEDGEENVPHRVWFQIYERILNDIKDEMKAQGREDEFLGSKIIYSTMRSVTCEELEWHLEDCLVLKQEFPHLVAGFDLVGHEDSLKPLIEYAEPLLRFLERQKELGVHIPFIFHAGETISDGGPADMNLYDAILLGTKRIGHGFSMAKHPKLMEMCREKGICLEICPISNEVLRLTGSMPMHPLPAILNHGVHVALCSDDPAVFGNMGLSYDFYQASANSPREVNSLATLREFVWDSIRFSSLDDEEKRVAFAALERRWTAFLRHVLGGYGESARSHSTASQ
ncbi:Metallo-dependent hydrolase [Pilatotrama ljubarskyi]|nr:Metallo-dependent hydrolase [Pilatotrama ljubarskyi]